MGERMEIIGDTAGTVCVVTVDDGDAMGALLDAVDVWTRGAASLHPLERAEWPLWVDDDTVAVCEAVRDDLGLAEVLAIAPTLEVVAR